MTRAKAARAPVLIANRGEIAIRVARTARALGFPVVAVYSEADRFAEHLRHSDRACFIGGAAPKESYLNVERIIDAAKSSGAKYVHPGYGFLSERPHFVEACEKAGLVFVGPSAESMRLMGDKIQARRTVDSLQVPRVPGSAGVVRDAAEAAAVARGIGYPILLKAAAGGGGKGMRRVDGEAEIHPAFESATREAQGAFGDGSMYVEKLILEPHHVEIQVFGDGKGKAIHLGERECSIQRRHQKVWEESPSPILNRFPKTREAMFEAALQVAAHVKYAGAGTFEFIVDGGGNFYFLEMNTRLQVEHPVTEWVTGVDLVAWQLLLAAGELRWPGIPERRGSAIEVRLYAEEPHGFLPAPGPLGLIQLPDGAFVRSDSAFSGPGEVSVHYDPMIAKISVWAPTRESAIDRLRVALDESRVEPPKKADGSQVGSLRTNLPFLKRLVRNAAVIGGDTTTDLIGRNPELTARVCPEPTFEAAVALAAYQMIRESGAAGPPSAAAEPSIWKLTARREGNSPVSGAQGKVGPVELAWKAVPRGAAGSAVVLAPDGREMEVRWRLDAEGIWVELPHGVYGYDIMGEAADDGRMTYEVSRRDGAGEWRGLAFQRAGELAAASAAGGARKGVRVRAQMPGKIIRLCVKPGDRVERDAAILVMEAMKMENEIRAPQAGRVGRVHVDVGQAVETGADLCVVEPES